MNAAEFLAAGHSSFRTDDHARAVIFAQDMKDNFSDLYDAYTAVYESLEICWAAWESG